MSERPSAAGPRRYFEDFAEGEGFELGSASLTAPEMVAFAREFDPQPFHIDEEAARASIYGGLIASGLHTIALWCRMFVTQVLNPAASMGSPGFDEMRWPNPVRPGDTLRGRWTVLECRASRSRPDRGIVRGRGEMVNQRGETVMTIVTVNFVGRAAERA